MPALAVAVIGLAISAGSAAYSISNAEEAKSDTKKEKRTRQAQADLQKRMEQARLRREARIKTARMLAAQGSQGAESSMVAGAEIGLRTSTEAGVELVESQTNLNREAINYNANAAVNQLNTQIAQNVGAVASESLNVGEQFFNNFFTEQPPTISDPSTYPSASGMYQPGGN